MFCRVTLPLKGIVPLLKILWIFKTFIKSSRGFLSINVKSKWSVLSPCRHCTLLEVPGPEIWHSLATSCGCVPAQALPRVSSASILSALQHEGLWSSHSPTQAVEKLNLGPSLVASPEDVFLTWEPGCLDWVPNLAVSREGSTGCFRLSLRNCFSCFH